VYTILIDQVSTCEVDVLRCTIFEKCPQQKTNNKRAFSECGASDFVETCRSTDVQLSYKSGVIAVRATAGLVINLEAWFHEPVYKKDYDSTRRILDCCVDAVAMVMLDRHRQT